MSLMPAAQSRPVLQRRRSVLEALQPGLDGMGVLIVTYYLIDNTIGALTYNYTILLLMLMGAMAVSYDQYGVYRINTGLTFKALNILRAWTAAFAFLVIVAFLSKQSHEYSRLLVAYIYLAGLLVQIVLHLLSRVIQKVWLKHGNNEEHVLIVGAGRLAGYLSQKIALNPWLGQRVVGAIAIDPEHENAETDQHLAFTKDLKVLGGVADIPAIIEAHQVQTVYFVTPLEAATVLEDLYFSLLDKHVAVHWVPDIFSLRLINHSVKEIAGVPVLTLSETPLTGTSLLAKTVEDIVLSALILVLFSPVLLAAALAVKLDSPGPIFFRQERMGWGGKVFKIWKFRSMYVHQPQDGVIKQAEKNDARVTRVGAFIRRTSIDELPQLFNVLTGDMSLVGPRPHAIQHDMEYSRRIADYFARHHIKPGITGLAQVRGFRGETRDIEHMAQRIESDIEYINNWSLWLDLTILVRTFGAFTGKSAY